MRHLASSFALIAAFLVSIQALAAKGGDVVRIQIGGEPSTLDPAKVIDQYGIGILRNVVEGLYKLDGDGKLQNGIAASVVVSKDGLVHRFKLRPDARWSDGKPVTPGDFVFGLRRALDPRTASPNAHFFFSIQNAKEAFEGKAPVDSIGVASEKDELVIRLVRPDPAFKLVLTLPTAAPVRQDVADASGGNWSPSWPVTGRYRIVTYRPAEQIELEPNPSNKTDGQMRVLYRVLPEEVTAMNLFESGHLDVITTVTATEIERLKKRDLIRTVPSTTVFYFSFNVSKPPFNDVEWRKAIAGAVDREGLAKVLNGVFTPIESYLPPNIEGHLPASSLASARKSSEASAAKIKAVANKPRVRLAYGASAFTKIVSEKVQQDLQTKLGLQVSLEPSELKTLLGKLKSDPPEMYFLGMSAVYDDPMNQLSAFSSVSGPNFSRYRSPELEKLLEKIGSTPAGKHRTKAIEAANRLIVEKDAVAVPMVLRLQVFGVSKKLKGFQVSPYQVIQLDQLRK